MFIIRFIGVLLTLFLCMIISGVTHIDIITVIAGMAFIVTMDSAITRYIMEKYLEALIQDEKDKKE